jgi:hypothetical protein
LAARGDYLASELESFLMSRWSRARGPQSAHLDTFGSYDRRILYQDIPEAVYPRGSVIFLGGSNLQRGLTLWRLPAAERSLMHNYGLSAVTFRQERQLLRYLVGHRQLLASGGDNITVVFGLFFGNVGQSPWWRRFLLLVVEQTGLYTWKPDEGLRLVPMSMPERVLRTEWARATSIRHYAKRLFDSTPRRACDPKAYRDEWADYVERSRQDTSESSTEVFARMLDYLRSKNVRVRAVLLPLGSWFDDFPFATSFRNDMFEVCAARGVPLTDLSHLLADEEFSDSAHYNYAGQLKFQDAMLRLLSDRAIPRASGPAENAAQ